MERKLVIYRRPNGKLPYLEWLESLKDTRTQDRIESRVDRLTLGNFGDHRSVGEGVMELRLHFGPGYRVYFAEDGDTIVVLLLGGDKSSQSRDIERAKEFLENYKESKVD